MRLELVISFLFIFEASFSSYLEEASYCIKNNKREREKKNNHDECDRVIICLEYMFNVGPNGLFMV